MKSFLVLLLTGALVGVGHAQSQNDQSTTTDQTTTTTTTKTTDSSQGQGTAQHESKQEKKESKDDLKVQDRLNDSAKILKQLTGAPDKGIPDEVLKNAKCVGVVPDMIKGGFIVGARYGRGVATCRTAHGWSAPAFFTLSGGSWGAQIGAEGVDLVMLFMNQKGADDLLAAKVKIGGEVSAAAGPVGRDAQASTDWKLNTGILTYSRAKGLYAGADLNGAYIRPDADSTKAFYGSDVPFRALLTGQHAVPAAAKPFLSTLRRDVHKAKGTASGSGE